MKPFPEDEAPRNLTYREYLTYGVLDFERYQWDGVSIDLIPNEQILSMDVGKVWELTYGLACVLEGLGLTHATLSAVSPTSLSTIPQELIARKQAALNATKGAETSPDPEHLS